LHFPHDEPRDGRPERLKRAGAELNTVGNRSRLPVFGDPPTRQSVFLPLKMSRDFMRALGLHLFDDRGDDFHPGVIKQGRND
jgi:hypothetical protein